MQTVTCKVVSQAKVAGPVAKAAPAAKPVPKILPKAGSFAAVLLSNAMVHGMARAEELSLPTISLPEVSLPDVTAAGSDLAALFQDNPFLVGGGIVLLLAPLGISAIANLGSGGAKVKYTSATRALEALGENSKVLLVDIRNKAEVKESGSPDLKSVKRKAIALPYTQVVKGEVLVDEAFGDKFAKLGGLDEESRVLLLDATGATASAAAKAILATGAVGTVYIVDGGADGPKGWKESGLPWKEPGKGLELPAIDLSALGAKIDPRNLSATVESLTEEFKAAPTVTKAGLAAGGLFAAGFLLFNEIEVVLQLVGLLAAGQFALKLLFAEDREKTLTEIRTLVKDKIAVDEAGEDLKKLATVLLEDTTAAPAAEKEEAKAATPAEPAAATEPAAPAPAAASGNGAGAAEEVPENVKEAQEWIANWKKKDSA